MQRLALTCSVTYRSLFSVFFFFFLVYFQTAKWIKSAAVLKHALGPGFTSMVPNGLCLLYLWKTAHTRIAFCVCVFNLFSLFCPLCRHNPSVYEITRAYLCFGGSHLGSEDASAGNHLGSTQSSFHSASSVLSTLWLKLFTLKGGRTQILCICKNSFFGSNWALGWGNSE